MKKLLEMLSAELSGAFEKAGYDGSYGRAVPSNRPDLCEFQCNGAMAAKKVYKKAPVEIAKDVAAKLSDSAVFSRAEAVMPGFLNLDLREAFLTDYLTQMAEDEELSVEKAKEPRTLIVDYGGPNVAKPLHVGHLRAAIIGECLKRLGRRLGDHVIGDVHLGDWGLQIGLIITELKKRKPDLVYFDPDYEGDYPEEAPFTLADLEEIYPAASARSKEDEAYREEALQATVELQQKRRGYYALWQQIMRLSVADLKENYRKLDVTFDLWKGEADVQDLIPVMVDQMKKDGFAYEDQGAWIVDVAEETDKKEVPPCMLLKSDGASLYTTTDLATIMDREQKYHPDEILYVVDKRQDMHFIQVFRCARKTGLVPDTTDLYFLGFGTMNGKDGTPFKTREGGVMRLEVLIEDIKNEMYKKIVENRGTRDEDAENTAAIVGLSAIKYGDLSNQATKDYVFDVERFTSFEGNTGPYILYTIVRIRSILSRFEEAGGDPSSCRIGKAASPDEKKLMLQAARYNEALSSAYAEKAPHRICSYIYELANDFNSFYHEHRILAEEDAEQQASWIALLVLVRRILLDAIDVLGFSAPERM
ncbi:MAG: arginine--tRNA ligase [Eubacterium sp.]|nr:arginine--tRNA ligase [Eubacterium sp.]